MRISIGFKIFGITVFLAAVMVVAAFLSESRIRSAQLRVEALAVDVLPLADLVSELRTIALRQEMGLRALTAMLVQDDEQVVIQARSAIEARAIEFEAKAEAMRVMILEAIERLPSPERRIQLTDIKDDLESLVEAHKQLKSLDQRIFKLHAEGKSQAEREMLDLLNSEIKVFEYADLALTKEIRSFAEALASASAEDGRLALSFEQLVTAVAAALGLLLAGIMAYALVRPLKNLRQAAIAVEQGDLSQQIVLSGRDELTDLAGAFNAMVSQLRETEKVEAVFGRYVDPRIVQRLIHEKGGDADAAAAGDKQEATVLFSDIAGYTSIAERLTPTGLVRLMNEYFDLASEPIAERGGLLDKFIGDAVMAFWCPPFSEAESKSTLAASAALAELEMLKEFHTRIPDITGLRADVPIVDIRIGLATGDVVVGSIGSERKRSFTVVGDTVNLASRLEGANKFYGTRILVCGRTRRSIGEQFTVREIDRLAVVGKSESVEIFELYCEGAAPENITRAFDAFAAGLAHYRNSEWDEAVKCFGETLELKPGDAPANTFLRRINILRTQPPPSGWDGIWHLTQK